MQDTVLSINFCEIKDYEKGCSKRKKIKFSYKEHISVNSQYAKKLYRNVFLSVYFDLFHFLISIALCVISYVVTEKDRIELYSILETEAIITIFLLIISFFKVIASQEYIGFVISTVTCLLGLIPDIFFLIQRKSIFTSWEYHSHMFSFSFFHMIEVTYLFNRIFPQIWIWRHASLYQTINRVLQAVFGVFTLLFISSFVFMFVEGGMPESLFNTYTNCLYFCVVTVTTVGFGDISPKTTLGKMFCSCYIIFFFVIFPIYITRLVSTALKGDKRSFKYIQRHTLICGDKAPIQHILPYIKNTTVIISQQIDSEFEELVDNKRYVFNGDPTNETDLKNSGVEHAKRVIIVAESDSKAYIECSAIAQMTSAYKLCYLKTNKFEEMFHQIGVDTIIEEHARLMMVGELCVPGFLKLMKQLYTTRNLRGLPTLMTIGVPKECVGERCDAVEMYLFSEFNIVVLAIQKGKKREYYGGEFRLKGDERIYVISNKESYKLLKRRTTKIEKEITLVTSHDTHHKIENIIEQTDDEKIVPLESRIIKRYDRENHRVIFGYNEGTKLLISKLLERCEEDILLLVTHVKLINRIDGDAWNDIKEGRVFIIEGDLYDKKLYKKSRLEK
ncbi:ion channel protein, partial [Entamoeba invadens IP1]